MLDGHVILIVGAAGRIASSVAKAVVEANGYVILVDVNSERLADLESSLGKDRCLSIVADTTLVENIDFCIAAGNSKFGKIDAAFYCAYPRSIGWGNKFEDIKKEHLDEDLSAQLGGSILFAQRILNFFRGQGFGNLIQVASIMGVVTPKFENYADTNMTSPIEYTAIKAAIIATTKYLAKYYKGNKIRVNCVSPGGILDQQPQSFLDKYRACCNDKGMLEAADLTGTILFLLSDNSKYLTGQNIIIDDGWSL